MFEKLNLFRRMREAEDRVEALEAETILYDAKICTLVEECGELSGIDERLLSLIERMVLNAVDKAKKDLLLVDTLSTSVTNLSAMNLSLKEGLTEVKR